MKTTRVRSVDVTAFLAENILSVVSPPLKARFMAEGAKALMDVPMDYLEPDTNIFRDAYWAAEAFSKTPWELSGVNREKAAFLKFEEAEEACRVANSRLVDWSNRASLSVSLLKRARQSIAAVLGEFSWNDCYAHFSFGPGASTSLPRRKAQRPNKWLGGHITESCLPLYLAFCRYNDGWESSPVTLVQGNNVTTVPKNAKTDRVIAIEPDWNMFFQRGIGGAIRYRLIKRLGLLTRTSQDKHKHLAQVGSATGSLATIDLQAASDSVSLALCEMLLPDDWFRAVQTTRCQYGTIQGKTIEYEKVSSMGNGFTFELETLIFWALARACCSSSDTLSVYGDDIVVDGARAEAVISLLQQVGFTINSRKTFIAGPFRESCGGHYHMGHDVTPPYFREFVTTELHHLIGAANKISRAASRRFPGIGLDGRFEHIWSDIARRIPRDFYGPASLGDAVLCVPFDVAHPRWCRKLQQFKVSGIVQSHDSTVHDHVGGVFNSLWGVVTEENRFQKPGSGRYRRKLLHAERWCDSGWWISTALCG